MTDISLHKVQLIKGTPPCMPGKCAICGGSGDQDSEFIDIGLELSFYGVVYLCSTCVYGDVLSTLDLVTLDNFNKIKEELEQTKFKLIAIESQNKELLSVVDSLRRVGFSESDTLVSPISGKSIVDEESKTAKSSNINATTTKSGSSEQDSSTGSKRVRNSNTSKESTPEFNL